MTKIRIGIGTGIIILTAILLGIVYVVAAQNENKDKSPIKLIAACENEGTQIVSCTWIPLNESKRTEAEKELAERIFSLP